MDLDAICESLSTFGFNETELRTSIQEVSPCDQYVRFDHVIEMAGVRTTYRGCDTEHGNEIAWNVFDLQNFNAQDVQVLAVKLTELHQLEHESIVRLYQAWMDTPSKSAVLLTELLSGGSLRQYLKKTHRPRRRVIKLWANGILQGLDYLSNRVHPIYIKDLKLENLFVDSTTGKIKIGDFRMNTLFEAAQLNVFSMPQYVAPEIQQKKHCVTCDVYSFGICLLEIATLMTPYNECRTPAGVYKRVINHHPPAVLRLIDDEGFKEFITVCIQPAATRPRASELLEHLYLAADDEGPLGHEPIALKSIVEIEEDIVNSVSTVEYLPESRISISIVVEVTGKFKQVTFPFSLRNDSITEVATEMVETLNLPSTSYILIAEIIQEKVNEALLDEQQTSRCLLPPTLSDGAPPAGYLITSESDEGDSSSPIRPNLLD